MAAVHEIKGGTTIITNTQKHFLIILGSVLFITVSLVSINESYYDSYKHEIVKYGNNVEKVIGQGADREDYADHIKRQLKKRGLKNVVVQMSGEDLYGVKNTVFIEVTPPPTKLDRLLRRDMKPIWTKYTFINGKR